MKKCDYCGVAAESLRPTPFLCDAGKVMCEECWKATCDAIILAEKREGEWES